VTTITDVARLAGVSKNTVSRFLNERGYISEKTRKSIQQAIDTLNYQPNQIARSLTSRSTKLIGLVIPDVTQPFFATMTSRIEDELDRRGYRMILCDTMHSSEKEKKYIDLLLGNKVDGIIIGSHSIDINYSDITAPIVALDRNLATDIPVVSADHKHGGEIAADWFIRHGSKKVLQLVGFSQVRTPSSQRHRVFADLLNRHDIMCLTYELDLNQFEFNSYIKTTGHILDEYKDIDGIFASDLVALAVQREAQARGMRIPDDLAIFGYDGSYVHEVAYPLLPTVVQPFTAIAEKLVDVLMQQINHQELESLSYVLDVKPSEAAR
jgi:LacI family sucrose operon transcriptional repressor